MRPAIRPEQQPRLRRLNTPDQRHDDYWAFATGIVADIAADLVGSNVVFHHSKLNFKWNDGADGVGWHQDIPFYPHSNYSPLTIGLYLADTEMAHGPVAVIDGSHEGPLYDHYDANGRWAGCLSESRCRDPGPDEGQISDRAGGLAHRSQLPHNPRLATERERRGPPPAAQRLRRGGRNALHRARSAGAVRSWRRSRARRARGGTPRRSAALPPCRPAGMVRTRRSTPISAARAGWCDRMGEDLCYTTALELVGLYESKRVSPVEVARAILERIERLNPILNCYCYCNRDDVLAAARQSEARWSLGEPLGPLDGVPRLHQGSAAYQGVADALRLQTDRPSRPLERGRSGGGAAARIGCRPARQGGDA